MTELERLAAIASGGVEEAKIMARKVQRERRFQSLALMAIVAWAGWQSTSTVEQKVAIAVVKEQQNEIIRDVARTRLEVNDRIESFEHRLNGFDRGAMVGPPPSDK